MNPYAVVDVFERAIGEYTGSPFVVATNSCTNALLISLDLVAMKHGQLEVGFPRRTYVSVPQVIKQAGHIAKPEDRKWFGSYVLTGTCVVDSARWFTSDMAEEGKLVCCSFHWTKHLALGLAGCVLCDNATDYDILKRLRFDGRREGIHPKDQSFPFRGRHCGITPATAAEGSQRLGLLPKHNNPLPNSDYPDLAAHPALWQ